MSADTQMPFSFRAFAEDAPGDAWRREFEQRWDAYKRWFLRFGDRERPSYLESMRALRTHMPEIIPVYEAMVELAGGGDRAARFLAQYCPPPLFRGCSQAVYIADEPVLVRSYDYSPWIFDGLVMRSRFGERAVLATLDCMSGALDGINSDGLAVSMSFGGRQEFGTGFGIPILLRYLLEFAGDVSEARAMLRRIPVNGAYNVMLLDRERRFDSIAIAPGREPLSLGTAVSTNHQPDSSWPIYEEKVQTHARYQHLESITAAGGQSAAEFSRRFLEPPLYNRQFGRGFGTLYCAAFYPERGYSEYFWPGHEWGFDLESFATREYQADFSDPNGYPAQSQVYGEIYTAKPIPVLNY